ncbi:MAG: hypothetical protein ACP5NK_06465 [Thermoplasmata archaeon]
MSEIDRRIRLHGELSFGWNDQLLEASNKFGLTSHGLLTNLGEDTGIEHIISSNLSETPDIRNVLKAMKAQEKSGFWVVEEVIPDKYVKEFLLKASSIKSVIIDSVQMKSGRIHLNFRFHESDLKNVSDLVLSTISGHNNATLEFLGLSKGIYHDFSRIARDMEVAAIDIKMSDGDKIFGVPVMSPPWTRVRRHFASGDREMRYIYHGESGNELKNENLHIISREDSLYEFAASGDLIKFVNSKVANEKIIRFGIVDHFDGKSLKTRFVLPKILVQSYLRILSLACTNFPEMKMVITGIRDLSEIAHDPI